MKTKTLMVLLLATILISGCIGVEKKPVKDDTLPSEISTTTTSTTTIIWNEVTTTTEETQISTTIQEETTEESSTQTQASIIPGTGISSLRSSTTLQSTTLPATCSSDDDCPPSFNSTNYCWTGDHTWGGDDKDIYMDLVEYVCSGKGTANARCVEARKRSWVDRCVASDCFNGLCYKTHCFNKRVDSDETAIDCGGECPDCSLKPNITCFNDCDCLDRESQFYTGFYRGCELNQFSASKFVSEEAKCHDRTVYQKLMTFECKKPGTVKSYCTSEFTQYMITGDCRNKNCTLDCFFKTSVYPNDFTVNNINLSFMSID